MLNALLGYLFGLLVYPAKRKRRAVLRGLPLIVLAVLMLGLPMLACCLNAQQNMAAAHARSALRLAQVRHSAAHNRR